MYRAMAGNGFRDMKFIPASRDGGKWIQGYEVHSCIGGLQIMGPVI